MFQHPFLARTALSCLCILQATATAAIDFNRTHATNPLWPGHARFHLVWQGLTVVLISAVELALIWLSGPSADGRFYLAVLLAALSPLGFLAALLFRRVFAGTLSDRNGVQPASIKLLGKVRRIDGSLIAVVACLIALVAIALSLRGFSPHAGCGPHQAGRHAEPE